MKHLSGVALVVFALCVVVLGPLWWRMSKENARASIADTGMAVNHDQYIAWHDGWNFGRLQGKCPAEWGMLLAVTQDNERAWSQLLRENFRRHTRTCESLGQTLADAMGNLLPTCQCPQPGTEVF